MQIEKGKQVYMGLCFACHQPDGKGLPGAFPPLAASDYSSPTATAPSAPCSRA